MQILWTILGRLVTPLFQFSLNFETCQSLEIYYNELKILAINVNDIKSTLNRQATSYKDMLRVYNICQNENLTGQTRQMLTKL